MGRNQVFIRVIFHKRSYYIWKLFLENGIGLLKLRGDTEAG